MTTTSDIRPPQRSRLPFRIDAWTATHTGHVRQNNEDAKRCSPAQGIFVIADGMGGHPAGEVASSIAVETCHDSLKRNASMIDAFKDAQRAVVDSAAADPRRFSMGTTLIAAKFSADGLVIGWTGDSRAYRYRAGVLHLLTADMGEGGYIREYIGKPGGAEVGLDHRSIQVNDKILLCTDGLSTYVEEKVIRERIRDGRTSRMIVDSLIGESLSQGGQDNVTISLIRIAR